LAAEWLPGPPDPLHFNPATYPAHPLGSAVVWHIPTNRLIRQIYLFALAAKEIDKAPLGINERSMRDKWGTAKGFRT